MDQAGIAFLDIIFFAMVAGFLILRLRSVLGRRSGDDANNPERWRSQKPAPGAPRGSEPLPENVARFPDRTAPAAPEGPAPAPGSVEAGVAEIRAADGSFDGDGFQQGARGAFEMIVQAFAQGETDALRPLLADPVYESFSAAIRERQAARQTLSTTLIGIKTAEIVEARMQGRDAFVTIRFVTEQVNVTRDAAGEVVDGDPNKVETITDVWTFTRNTRARDPNWFLVQTATSH
jgi:predicted lipid-binding transport protein (Tim44 family)